MTDKEYQDKKRECWENIKFALRAPNTDRKTFDFIFDRAYALGKQEIKQETDAEGEEMLTVSRKEIQQLVSANDELIKKYPGRDSIEAIQAKTVSTILNRLFGSKCLPDEKMDPERLINIIKDSMEHPLPDEMLLGGITKPEPLPSENFCQVGPPRDLPNGVETAASTDPLSQNFTENCDNANHISTDCDKPVEPKFNLGDIVRFKYCCTTYRIDGFKMSDGVMLYQVGEVWAEESDLEPYTGPEENIAETRNFSQDCDKQFDNILKDSFAKERRLNIAAQMMQGLICAPLIPGVDPNPSAEYLAQAAFRLADALIAEAEKGGSK